MDLPRILMYFVILVTRRLCAENDECLRSKQFENTGKGEFEENVDNSQGLIFASFLF